MTSPRTHPADDTERRAVTIGQPDQTGWHVVTDSGERAHLHRDQANGLRLVPGQRVVATVDAEGKATGAELATSPLLQS